MNAFVIRVVQGKEAEERNGARAGLKREGECLVNLPYAEFGFVGVS